MATTVTINPIPEAYRRHPERLWPCFPPIFDGPPTQQDCELALELWRLLDPASKRWYSYYRVNPNVRQFCGLPLTDDDIASMRSES
jgi:hypothetical protein